MDESPRRDRAWSKPERESAPAWPVKTMPLFVGLLGLCFLGALTWALAEYVGTVSPKVLDQLPKIAEAEHAPQATVNRANPTSDATHGEDLPPIIPAEAMEIARLPKGSVGEAARLFAKEKQQSAITNAKAALQELELVQAEAKQWAEKVEPLLTNDAGRKIAANVELVDQFTALMAEDRPVAVNAADKMRVIHEAIEPIEQALPDPNNTLAVSGEIVATLDDYRKQAKQTAEAMRKLRLRVEHLVRTAEAEAPAATTLKQAMEEREVALAAEDANELKEKLAATRAEATKKRIAAEQEAIRMQSEQEQADILARAEKEKLVARAKSADVKHYLATFLARSYFQPVGNYMSVKYERTNEELPVSYTRIKSSGALDKSVQGLRTLVILASPGWSGNGNWHDRPPWQFDVQTFTWSKSDQEFIQKAQDLLRELGPTLAELKMLAP